jgi:uncharacterized repeat protein (TIGR03847 family)
MVRFDDDYIFPVTRITTGAVGEPGRRVFVLQAHVGGEPFSWVIEKSQAAALGKLIPQLLQEIRAEYPELGEPLVAAKPNLALSEPLEPEFRVANIGLGYDRLHDLVVLTLAQAEEEDLDETALDEERLGAEEVLGQERYAHEDVVESALPSEVLLSEALMPEDIDSEGLDQADIAGQGEAEGEEGAELQLYATRGQALLLSQQVELVIAAGRPACPNCGQPIDDFGHFCLPPSARTKWNSDYLQ